MRQLVEITRFLLFGQALTNEISTLIRQKAFKLATKFGGCADLPVCYPEDFRKTFCRLVVALAVFDLATDEDYQVVTPNEQHVGFMATFLDEIYSADNCRLDAYSKLYEDEHTLGDAENLFTELKEHMTKSEETGKRVRFMISELLHLDPLGTERISQKYFQDQLDINRSTVFRNLMPFVKHKLIKSSRGYQPTTKLFQFINYVEKCYGDFFEMKIEGSNQIMS